MCGITGILAARGRTVEAATIQAMTDRLAHRGPDDSGAWRATNGTVGFGHRRLSIIDLSAAGHQPMTSASGRYVITYNGEVYNFRELRRELAAAGFRFKGNSDTEVILAALERWGVEPALHKFVGMFALGLWDRHDEALYLVRDRLGIKPLYYAQTPHGLAFASELRPFAEWSAVSLDISRDALALYLRYGYVPAPHSIFQAIKKLPSGCVLVARHGAVREIRRYWDIREVAQNGLANPFQGSEQEAGDELESHLVEAVKSRMVADVPLGVFLSGGIDSSTVTALMQAHSDRPVETFSIGFHESDYNEAVHAAAVARHLGTRHTELYVSDADARNIIPDLPTIFDEPFADSSQIPTTIVARLARRNVTVALSGDGGDETFGGYNRYVFVSRFWNYLRACPAPVRGAMADLIRRFGPGTWDRIFRSIGTALPANWVPALPGDKMHKLAIVLGAGDLGSLHRLVVSQWHDPERLVVGADPAAQAEPLDLPNADDMHRQMCVDTRTYLVDDILTKVDRATMSVSLEGRVPLLDHRVVAFAWRLPSRLKFRHGQGKWILRQVLQRYVPQALIERPKMGFGIPVGDWMRGPMRSWAEAYLDPRRLAAEGLLDPDVVQQTWRMHLSRRVERTGPLWAVLMLEVWLEHMRQWRTSAKAIPPRRDKSNISAALET